MKKTYKKLLKLGQKLGRFKSKNPGTFEKVIAAVFCLVVAGVGTYMLVFSKAESFCDINPANDTQSVEAAINGCANGSTIRFPAGASYSLNDTIFVRDRHNLVIDGMGSTFTITTDGLTKPSLQRLRPDLGNTYDCSKNGGNWMLLRGSNVTLKNMTAIGSFPLAGKYPSAQYPDKDAKLGQDVPRVSYENAPEFVQEHKNVCTSNPNFAWMRYTEGMSNYGIYGTDGAYLQDLTGKAPWGDTIVTGPDLYVDNYDLKYGGTAGQGNFSKNIFVKRVRAEETSRMCFAFTSGSNIWLEDSSCKSGWYGGSDEEIDSPGQPMENVHILRNTWEGYGLFGFAVPVPGDKIQNIEIRDNVFKTLADNQCAAIINMGGYPNHPESVKNVTIENNNFVSKGGSTFAFARVDGAKVRNNKITNIGNAGCGSTLTVDLQLNSNGQQTNANIIQENNGPNAPGANTTTNPVDEPPDTEPPITSDTTPPIISNPVATNITGTGVTLTWTTNEPSSSVVEFGETASYGNSRVFDLNPLVTNHSVSITGLTANTIYHYKVMSSDSSNNMATSSDLTFKTATTSSCNAPANFVGTPGAAGSGRYNFNWSASAGASEYNLYFAAAPNQPTNRYSGPFTTTSGSAFSLVPGQQYNFAIRATCGSNVSANSNVVAITAPSGNTNPGVTGDLNGDGKVNFDDAMVLIRKWNTADSSADVVPDGKIDFNDALYIIRNWKD